MPRSHDSPEYPVSDPGVPLGARGLRRSLLPLGGLFAALLLFTAEPAFAQNQISGRVTDALGQRPLVGAQVTVPGTGQGVMTDNRGAFTLTGLTGTEVTVRVQMLGYRVMERTVAVGSTGVVFQMSESAIALDEVVVTGTVGERQRRSIGNVVGRLDASNLQEVAPVTQVQDMLSAQVPGVRIMRSGGEIGTGGTTRIRGASSLSLSGNPILYIDGIRADGSDYTGGVGTFSFAAGNLPSRINDLNPEDIESIEVIKGPAAATLYGTEASNGVIHVITKKGARGAPQINMRLREGAYWLPDATNYFNPTYFRCTGASQQPGVDPILQCNPGEIVAVNVLALDKALMGQDWFRTGRQPAIGADISGGSESVRYFFSADWAREEGYLPYNWQNRLSGRANMGYTPTDRINIDFSLGGSRSRAQSASTQQPLSTHIIWSCPAPGCEAGSGLPNALDGPLRGYIGAVPEIFEQEVEGFQNVDRVTASVNFNHRPWDWFSHRVAVGTEFTNIQDTDLRRGTRSQQFIGNSLNEGMKRVGSTRGTHFTFDYGASGAWQASERITLTTSVGAQYFERRQESSQARGDVFPLEALETVSAAADRFAFEEFWENKTVGVYVQEEFGLDNRLFITAAVRGDDNSAFGEDFTFVTYPKFSASWVVGEERFLEDVEWLSSLRVRAAWGQSGMQPNFFDALRTFQPVIGMNGLPAVTPQNIGNPDLKPEVGNELEFGFDASFLDERVSLEFTRFSQRTRDALVRVPALPSLGFPGVQLRNLGEVRNSGVELGLNVQAWQGDRASLDLGFTASSAKNEIADLGGQAFLVQLASMGQYHVEGFPLGGIFSRRVVSADLVEGATPAQNVATNILCEGGERVPGTNFSRGGGAPVACDQAPDIYWGQPLPEWEGSFTATLSWGENLSFFGMVDYIRGRTWVDNDVIAVHSFFLNSREALERTDPILLAYRQLGEFRQPGILSGDFAKLRTLSMQYRFPAAWAQRVGASRLSMTLTGENLATLWRPDETSFGHRSLDPERTRQTGGETPGLNAFNQERWPSGRRMTLMTRVSF
jgi:TonB-linked SusC/RagA family outer membrane protein